MASTAYPLWKREVIKGTSGTSLDGATLTALLVDTADYTYNAAHEFVTSVPSGARVATVDLANVTITNTGNTTKVDCDDWVWPLVSGDQSEAIVIYINTGVEATSRLWLYIDNALGLPYTPLGLNIPFIVNVDGLWNY